MSDAHATRQWLRSTLHVGPHAGAHRVAARAAVSLGVPLVVVVLVLDRADLSIYATFAAFAALYGRFDAHADRLRMQLAAGTMLIVGMALGTLLSFGDVPMPVAAVAVAVFGGVVTVLAGAARWHPPGALFAVFAIGATAGIPAESVRWADAALAAVATLAFALLVGSIGRWHPAVRRMPRAPRPPRTATSWRPLLRDGAIITVTVAVAGIVVGLFSDHGYWAQVAAVAALGGPTLAARLTRATQRLAGTAVGVLLAGGLLLLDPAPWAVVLAAIMLQIGAELFVGRNYALTVLCVTPLALLMVHLVAPTEPGLLVRDRVLDTLVGVAFGVVAAVVAARMARREA
jgi:hypothetical protein